MTLGNPDVTQVPQIAWTGVPGLGHPLASPPAITFTGDNLLLTVVQLMSTTKLQLDSW